MGEVHTEEGPKADILVLIEGRARYLAHLGHVKTPEILRGCASEITRLRAALADAQAVGFAAGVEAAAGEVNGWKVLGGYGELVDKIRALTPPNPTAAAARVLLDVWPTDASFDAAFNACAASYHGGDQMQDEMDRTLATVSAALRAIAGDTP